MGVALDAEGAVTEILERLDEEWASPPIGWFSMRLFAWTVGLFVLSFVASTLLIRLGVSRLTSDPPTAWGRGAPA